MLRNFEKFLLDWWQGRKVRLWVELWFSLVDRNQFIHDFFILYIYIPIFCVFVVHFCLLKIWNRWTVRNMVRHLNILIFHSTTMKLISSIIMEWCTLTAHRVQRHYYCSYFIFLNYLIMFIHHIIIKLRFPWMNLIHSRPWRVDPQFLEESHLPDKQGNSSIDPIYQPYSYMWFWPIKW